MAIIIKSNELEEFNAEQLPHTHFFIIKQYNEEIKYGTAYCECGEFIALKDWEE